ncbi:MAG: DUF2993 domain-containing protein [Synergistaceae bacterium]
MRLSRKAVIVFVIMVTTLLFAAVTSYADTGRVEEMVGKLLVREFAPDSIYVQATNGGSFLYAKASGIVLEGVRIDNISISAMMKGMPGEAQTRDKYGLSDMIYMSRGEIVLLTKDINDYFMKTMDTVKGFKNLKCVFSKDGFKISGVYTAKFIFTFNIRLSATGKLGIKEDGLHLVDTSFFIDGVRQPDMITKRLLAEINPLIKRKKIPFPVRLDEVKMSSDKIIITGQPRPLDSGSTWKYTK